MLFDFEESTNLIQSMKTL